MRPDRPANPAHCPYLTRQTTSSLRAEFSGRTRSLRGLVAGVGTARFVAPEWRGNEGTVAARLFVLHQVPPDLGESPLDTIKGP